MATEFHFTAHIRSRGKDAVAKTGGARARRWVVHSWLNRFRRILIK